MYRGKREVGGYRGRKTASEMLRWIAVILFVLVVVVLAALWLGGDRLAAWQEEQAQKRQETSASQSVSSEEQSAAGEDVSTPAPDASVTPEPQPEPEPEPAPVVPEPVNGMKAAELPLSALLDGTAAQVLTEKGADAVVVTMKDREGRLGWQSQQPLAAKGGVNSTNAEVNQKLTEWNAGETWTVARVVCFRDNTVPYQQNSVALRASYGNWRDDLKLRWLDPASPDVQSYIVGLVGELAQLGFDEILLEDCTLPTAGNLDVIKWSNADAASTIPAFLEQARAAAEAGGAKLSIRTTPEVVSGQASGGGLNLDVLNRVANRVWMPAGETDILPVLTAAGLEKPEERVVQTVPAMEGDTPLHRAVLAG